MNLLNLYAALCRRAMAVQLQYRAALVIWLIGMVLEPVVYLSVWSAVARSKGGSVEGLTPRAFAGYFICVMIAHHLTFCWHNWEYEFRIRQGQLSPLLLRPAHPLTVDVADNIVYKFLTTSIMVPAGVTLWYAFGAEGNVTVTGALLTPLALAAAFAIKFMISSTVAMLAFFTTRLTAINMTLYIVELFLGGQMAPLELLPPMIRQVAQYSPFRWIVAFPADVFLGRVKPEEFAQGFAIQCLWIAVTGGILALAWRGSIKRYSAVGA